MRVGIIGAGVAGLATAKTLMQAGHEVVVHDSAPDVGGVWSRTRRYPGLTTQSAKSTYGLSDYPMPKDLPEWPTGAQVQSWLAAYAESFDIALRLNTRVARAAPLPEGRWSLTFDSGDSDVVDKLVVANGVFCEPHVPDFSGQEAFIEAGGQVMAGTEMHDASMARGKNVLVVGYGKSACDVTVPLSQEAASTHVIARQLLWKMPRKIANVVNFKMLLLTRMGEALFRYHRLRGVEKFLHGPANPVRRSMLNSIGTVSRRQFKLDKLGLVPRGAMEDIVKGAIGLATEGFFEGVEQGSIVVHRDTTITRLRPGFAELSDGTTLPADLIVCSTGFKQSVPFLDVPDLQDDRGNFLLYRQILPLSADGLYFNGYNSSFFSPLNAEMAAVWIAAHLAGAVPLPAPDEMRTQVEKQIAFMDEATDRHHCHGTKIIPFSMKNVDEVLGDLDLNISKRVRASHWLNPIDPSAYREVTPALVARLRAQSPAGIPPRPTSLPSGSR